MISRGLTVIELAVGEDQLQLCDAQHATLQSVRVHATVPNPPQMGMCRAHGLGRAPLVISVLLLKVLGPEKQALTPQNFGCLDQRSSRAAAAPVPKKSLIGTAHPLNAESQAVHSKGHPPPHSERSRERQG